MSLATARKHFEQAQKKFEQEQKKLGKDLRKAIVDALAATIPEGWFLQWTHDDQSYDDESYSFDFRGIHLITERVPIKGRMLTPGRPKKYKTSIDSWTKQNYQECIDYGEEPTYEWTLDEKCEKRTDWDWPDEMEDPGCIELGDPCKELGLTKKDQAELQSLFRSIKSQEIMLAFGACATVVVYRNGKCTIDEQDSDGE